jgi:hypothetical protein
MADTGVTTINIAFDGSRAKAALSELERNLAGPFGPRCLEIIEQAGDFEKLFRLETEPMALGATELRIGLEPTEALLNCLPTMRAVDRNDLGVEHG